MFKKTRIQLRRKLDRRANSYAGMTTLILVFKYAFLLWVFVNQKYHISVEIFVPKKDIKKDDLYEFKIE